MSFNLVDFAVFLGIAQGLFLAIALPMAHKGNRNANLALSLLLLIGCAMLIARTLFLKIDKEWILLWINVADIFIFLFGPLAYLYFKRLFFERKPQFTLGAIHFIPAGLFVLFLIYVFQFSVEEYKTMLFSGRFYYPFMIIEGIAIILNFLYCYKIKKLLDDYRQIEKEQLSFTQETIRFAGVILTIILLLILAWAVSYIGRYVLRDSLPFINYETIWIGIPIVIYIVGFYALKQPEIFRMHVDTKNKSTVRNRLNPEEIELLKEQLDTLIMQEQVFLNNDLTLKELSERLKTSTNNLSWFLNNIYHTNFYDYINKFRIAAYLKKIQKGEHLKKTLSALSLEVGFNSKSTFNKAFKAALKETPSNYIKKLNN